MITRRSLFVIAATSLALLSLTPVVIAGGRGKDFYVEEYQFKKPMNGYTGRQGNYWCDYVKVPNRKCDSKGNNCKIVSWTLRQTCY